MKRICPNCERLSEVSFKNEIKEYEIKGEKIEVEVKYLICSDCGEIYFDPNEAEDPLELAYNEYRRMRGMMQPGEIKSIRNKYGLTQKELSDLLGWGGATISRYENGALQDEAHDKLLQMAMKPENLLHLIESNSAVLTPSKYKHLVKSLTSAEAVAHTFEKLFIDRFGTYPTDINCGFRKFDFSKLLNAILYLCKEGVYKTTLNKLLFFADFLHYRDYAVSITGLRYAHLPHGPTPDNYDLLYGILVQFEILEDKEIIFNEDVSGIKYHSNQEPNLNIFDNSELKVLTSIKDYFKAFTARKIRDFSHNEKGYNETNNSDIISYEYAENLQLEL